MISSRVPLDPTQTFQISFLLLWVSSLLVILLLLLGLSGGLGDTVQITLAGLSDAAATLVLVLLENTNLLEGLHDLALDGAGGIDVVRGRTPRFLAVPWTLRRRPTPTVLRM